jgi:arylsulfatase A-like enzyme
MIVASCLRPLLVALVVVQAPVALLAADATTTRPNVIVILADDLGYGSVGCYGAKPEHVRTPHIDRLAAEGRRFTDAHTPGSVCSPTRYALITGRYCWRLSRTGVFGTHDPLKIETTRPTLGSLFTQAGYRTAVVGKWHLGLGATKPTDYTKPLVPGPREIGFGYDLLVAQNHGDVTNVFIENGRVAGLRSATLTPGPINSYGKPTLGLDAPQRVDEQTNGVLADKAVAWLADSTSKQPFFLYFAPVAVHNPITPSVANRGKSGCGSYGDFLMDLDDSVGRLMAEVDRLGQRNNTIVLFTSDNGGELAQGKDDSPQVAATRAGLQINGPWRGGKHGVFEGGFRVPYLVRWPARIAPGTTSSQTINLVDTMATLAAIIGAPLPAEAQGAEDSVDVSSAWLQSTAAEPRRAMITVSEDGVFAIRRGAWKWIEGVPAAKVGAKHPRAVEHRPRLVDLATDPGETGDVSAQNPQVVTELKTLLEQCRSATSSRAMLSSTAP